MFEPGLGIIVAPVHVPRLRVGGQTSSIMASCARSAAVHPKARHGKTRLIIVSESSRFRRIYSFVVIPCLLQRHVPEHAGRGGLAAPGKAAKTGLLPVLERGSPDGIQFHPDILLRRHTDAGEGRDERALLDRHAAEGERPDIPAPAELFGELYQPSSSA